MHAKTREDIPQSVRSLYSRIDLAARKPCLGCSRASWTLYCPRCAPSMTTRFDEKFRIPAMEGGNDGYTEVGY